MTLQEIQSAVGQWSRTNFPNNTPVDPLLGIVEEVGEFDMAWMGDEREAILDSIADIFIYACDFAERNELKAYEPYNSGNSIIQITSKICHHTLKMRQGIRGDANQHKLALQEYLSHLVGWAKSETEDVMHIKFEDLVTDIWNKVVSKRNWIANPSTGI